MLTDLERLFDHILFLLLLDVRCQLDDLLDFGIDLFPSGLTVLGIGNLFLLFIIRFNLFRRLVGLLFVHFHGLLIQLLVALNHEPLECKEVVNSYNLVDNLLMQWVLGSLVACLNELLICDAQLSHQFGEQIFDNFFKVLNTTIVNETNNLHCEFL